MYVLVQEAEVLSRRTIPPDAILRIDGTHFDTPNAPIAGRGLPTLGLEAADLVICPSEDFYFGYFETQDFHNGTARIEHGSKPKRS